MSEILVHNNWDPLEEIWLGDIWPEHFYDDLEPELRDAFCQVTEWTKHDLNNIQKKLEEFNVIVRRPDVSGNKDIYIDHEHTKKLLKPPITPRDYNAVINNKLYFGDSSIRSCYQPLLDLYPKENVLYTPLSGAGIVKLGKDIIVDRFTEPHTVETIFQDFKFFDKKHYERLAKDYRIHYATNGGHTDCCFMPLKEGLILTTSYWEDYERMFPGWKRIELQHPTYSKTRWGNRNGERWNVPNLNSPRHFNQYLETYCKNWIGNYTETYFEVNVVMIDEKNMLCMGVHEELFNDLEKEGITCHVVPFRTRAFWDGGIHCITLDIRRRSTIKDYFPDRGEPGLKSILDKIFEDDAPAFLEKFNAWKASQKDY